jgi:uncharacterized protein (TIGR02145 family)
MFNSDNNNAIDSNSTQFTDPRDNNTYKTQKIGSLVWFTENLRFKTPNSSGYKNAEIDFNKYGQYYSSEDIDNICPDGWRVPTLEDWTEIKEYMNTNFKIEVINKWTLYPNKKWNAKKGSKWDTTNTSHGYMINILSNDSLINNSNFLNIIPSGWKEANKFEVGIGATFWFDDKKNKENNFHSHIGSKGVFFHSHDHYITKKPIRKFPVRCVCDHIEGKE